MNSFKFGTVDSSEYGVYISEKESYKKPARKYTSQTVPGRNGSLFHDEESFEDVELSFMCVIRREFKEKFEDFIDDLHGQTGVQKFTESAHPDYFRMGTFVAPVEPTPSLQHRDGSFELKFTFKPQCFLNTGTAEVTLAANSNTTFTNPSNQYALPLIRTTGAGAVTVGDTRITVTEATVIDCDLQDCYSPSNGANLNSTVTLSPNAFPRFGPGDTTIITTVKCYVTPRWWRI